MSAPLLAPLVRVLSATLAAALRAVVLLSGAALLIGALLLGLVLALAAVLWALLRGRRPALAQFRWRARTPHRGTGRQVPPGEVIDVQAREILPPDGR